MTSEQVDRISRVALLLSMLEESERTDIVAKFPQELTQQLQPEIERAAASNPSVKRRQSVLSQFADLLQMLRQYERPKLRLHVEDDSDDLADEPVVPYKPTGNPVRDLELMNVHQVAAAFEREHPRTVAVLMKCLSPQRNAEILSLLSESVRNAVVQQLSLDPAATDLVVEQMAKGTVERALTFPAKRVEQTTAATRLAEVLRQTERSGRKEILNAVAQQNAELADAVRRELYRFEDIGNLGDREIQLVLGKVDGGTLAIAMFDCTDEVQDRIFGNLTRRARSTLQEELEFQKHLPKSQVEAARAAVAEAIAEVDQEAE
ncbi:MAG: hypothetical protein KDA88_18820 [Planctomycetaceae bacterium]|nr:hypothetical protein [Planctomycetaceae bacterium]MCB9952614.1 hypothetical protein [Planctomycetaceae bacterium]